MEKLIKEVADAFNRRNGYDLAKTITPNSPPERTRVILEKRWLEKDILRLLSKEARGNREILQFADLYGIYWEYLKELYDQQQGRSSWRHVYERWKSVASYLIKAYQAQEDSLEAWTIPCLYIAGKHLRKLAISSDQEIQRGEVSNDTQPSLEEPSLEQDDQRCLRDCEQVLKRMFSLCLMDRAPIEISRKWGLYYIVNLLFKTYFKLNSASLSKSILKTLKSYKDKGDLPALSQFPKSQQCTYKYYEGVLCFLEENYAEAETHLTAAWNMCHSGAQTQLERILTYLIPCRLVHRLVLPTKALLEPFPRLQQLFLPLAKCIKQGNLKAFDQALISGEEEFVKRRIYLTLERCRDVAVRNLFRKVYLAAGFDSLKEGEETLTRRTRITLSEFQVAVSMGSDGVMHDADEVECLIANMFYKELMKGYIARERGIVVLSKKNPFPMTNL